MRVDFYILKSVGKESCMQFACRLTEKAYGLSNRVYAHTATPQEAKQLDELLWTYRQGSFVPHQLLTATRDRRAQVSIGAGGDHESDGDLLINLSDELPDFAQGFERIAEIVAGDETSVHAGRQRFKRYRDMGLKPETHKID